MTVQTVLVATVGGSHQPIVRSIDTQRPDYVCFVCTDRDAATAESGSGSRKQIEGKGKVIKANKDDPAPTLPNIPTQCGLNADQYEVLIVSSDDLDDVYQKIATRLGDLLKECPDAAFRADYTGGTKSMTAGLVLAALEYPEVSINLVTGARADLHQVHAGTESLVAASTDGIRLRRRMAPYLDMWEHFGYGEAAAGLESIPTPQNSDLRAELQLARDLSHAFDAWDRFDHQTARERLNIYRGRIARQFHVGLTFLDALNEDGPRLQPARLLDLWMNAERRAARRRYDDAAARAYRLLEGTAQWLLDDRAGIDTAQLDPGQIPDDMDLTPNRQGRLQAGLFSAWTLVAHQLNGPAVAFFQSQSDPMHNHIQIRNRSILAHGFHPVTTDQWEAFHQWMSEHFIPMLQEEVQASGRPLTPQQFPTNFRALAGTT